ncbi:Crp/Fnr family transcriptional regulator [Chitinophagaceae bacterium 26-R-25]|nr:Crp/Fnr family transcriptional regulator [Chitinophagaceae bacterium 26-R-25]
MYEVLFQYIEAKSKQPLTDEERELIQSKFKLRGYRKRQYFLQEGDICKHVAFVVRGAARMFSVDEKGIEHIVRFALETWWLGDLESVRQLTPSHYNIELLENADLLVISTAEAFELRDKCRPFDLMFTAVDYQANIAAQKRIHAAISLTAEERYEELAKTYPEFIQRFPQNMIASYLGLSPETLSRIRKHILNK